MCAWSISVEKGYNISMFVEFFQTEKEFDVLQVYDGNHRLYLLDIHKFKCSKYTFRPSIQTTAYMTLFYLKDNFRSSNIKLTYIPYENTT
jgi:hypothetical protein